eukprot:gnl/MRDRNA2_/MRDRNA2_106281_c0_seq1.p1 gnl/MRDRNA2_/MRDRNA2_106281_c0~~gnl/MRDRNA2_/MRDRNA2_106281_c0_seq1.p1  ORF type:complete len:618 (+),score=68.37 gnl/MRDRNA2_/MRDRNA2_106281_c0_seq1:36-1889(+)
MISINVIVALALVPHAAARLDSLSDVQLESPHALATTSYHHSSNSNHQDRQNLKPSPRSSFFESYHAKVDRDHLGFSFLPNTLDRNLQLIAQFSKVGAVSAAAIPNHGVLSSDESIERIAGEPYVFFIIILVVCILIIGCSVAYCCPAAYPPSEAEQVERQGDVALEDLPDLFGVRNITLYVGLISFINYMALASVIASVPYMMSEVQAEYGVSRSESVLLGSCILFGSIFSSLLLTPYSDRIGRRLFLLMCCVGTVALAALQLLLPSGPFGWACLLALRFALGIFYVGLINVTHVYFLEFVPDSVRGQAVSLIGIGWPLGSAATIYFSQQFAGEWRLVLALPPMVNCTLGTLLLYCAPESPRWLLISGRETEGYMSVSRVLRSKVLVAMEGTRNVLPARVMIPPHSNAGNLWQQLQALFEPELRTTTIVACALYSIIAGISYSLLFWAPSLLKQMSSANSLAYELFLWGEAVGLVASLVSAVVLDMCGRKATYVVSAVLTAVSIAALPFSVLHGGEPGVYFCYLSAVFGTCLMWGVVSVYAPEAFPTLLRGSGAGLASGSARVSAAVTPIIIGLILELSVDAAFWTLGVISLVGAAVAFCIPKEMANAKLMDATKF